MKRPLDLTLAIAGVLATILVIGTIVLAALGREIPSVLVTGVLAALGFFFSKGVGAVISSVTQTPENRPPPSPEEGGSQR